MKSNSLLTMVIASFLWTGFVAQAAAGELVLAGSTTVQKRILEPTAAAIEKATGVTIKVLGINTGKGLQELVAGKVKASIASSPLDMALKKAGLANEGFQEHIILQDTVVPIVNSSNPVSSLTREQLTDLNTGKASNWNQVGGPDMAVVVITSQPTAATRIFFQEEVMKGAAYIDKAREVASTRMEIEMVSKLKGGIGAVSEGFIKLNPGLVKVVKSDPPITRPLSFITKGAPDPEVKAVIDFLKTPEAQKLFQ